MIYLTGDTHGSIDIDKLTTKNFDSSGMTKNDYVIILGDFGFIWKNEIDDTEKYWMKFFQNKPWTTLFIDGNHENHKRLNAYPISQWKGGNVHKINDSVMHLMRGQIYELQGKSFFTFGGAASIDKNYRITDVSWWKEELPSYKEQNIAFDNLSLHNNKVDYVLTHACPQSMLYELVYARVINDIFDDPTSYLLEEISKCISFKHWYFGHYHTDLQINDKFTCMYNNIVRLL